MNIDYNIPAIGTQVILAAGALLVMLAGGSVLGVPFLTGVLAPLGDRLGLAWGAIASAAVIFFLPLTLLAMAGPYVIRLRARHVRRVGSTSGGLKVLRVGVLLKMVGRQMRRLIYGARSQNPVVVDGEIVETAELRRIAALFFAWMALLLAGSLVTALLSDHGALESASGMFSALGNIGPCYIAVGDMPVLHPVIKIVYILGMVAGRLEILPLLLLFSPRTWR